MPIGERYEFSEFTLDTAERRLLRRGVVVRLAPKALDLLVELVRHAGRLVTRRELLARVWPDASVEEGIVTVYVSGLRKALEDDERTATYIETVPRSGYRFVAPVTKSVDKPEPPSNGARPLKAFELVGWGRKHLFSASFFRLVDAVSAFQAAIAIDPTYAAAHAGLAIARISQAVLRAMPFEDAYAEAKASALRALAMDDGCADGLVALGAILLESEWDWVGAERSFQRALDLDRNHTEAYVFYGALMEACGRLDRGLQFKQQALERDPESGFVLVQIAVSFWNQRRYHDTIEWANKALAVEPRQPMARELIGGAYWKLGDFKRKTETDVAHARSFGASDEALAVMQARGAMLEQLYCAGGHAAVARYLLEHMSAADTRRVGLELPVLYGEAGEMDAAFAELDRALELRDPALPHLAVAPQWDSLRGDPRFNHLLTRMGLPLV
jgi:DNA-binding winged helix-turn-helix (wHTH) protein